ncbi:MAG: hypothetical protein FJX73_09790 [Armatimonadetes bacterium]|nr:hypothetical protein [Armatimonadota bacterium]
MKVALLACGLIVFGLPSTWPTGSAVGQVGSQQPDVHRTATIVDLHCDTLLDLHARRRTLAERSAPGHVDLPRLREGGGRVQVFAAYTAPGQGPARAWELIRALHDALTANALQIGPATTVGKIEAAFWDAMRTTRGPLLASHSNAAALRPHPRNLTDEQLRAIAGRGGVVGVNFWPELLGEATAERVLSRLPNLTIGLLRRGYNVEQIHKILGGNALRVFSRVWRN